MLFKEFAGVDAFPLCVDTTDVEAIVAIVKAVAPTFGCVNLGDIARGGAAPASPRSSSISTASSR